MAGLAGSVASVDSSGGLMCRPPIGWGCIMSPANSADIEVAVCGFGIWWSNELPMSKF